MSKKNKTEKPQGTEGAIPSLPPREALEMVNRVIGKLLEKQNIQNIEEAQKFIDQITREKTLDQILAEYGDDPKERAQELAFEALDTDDPKKALKLVRQALELDPECIDALRTEAVLGSRSPAEAITRLRETVARAEQALGQEFMDNARGHFWGLIETRPYMRARHDLMVILIQTAHPAEAMAEGEAMLELNPGDNQGVRDTLLGLYLGDDDRLAEARRLLERYNDDARGLFAWASVLERFIAGDLPGAEAALARAEKANRHVVEIMTTGKPPKSTGDPFTIGYALGSPEEAMFTILTLGVAMAKHPDFIDWIFTQRPPQPAKEKGRARRNKLPRATAEEKGQAYIFKVWLTGEKQIWRRIAVHGVNTLDDLHEAIFKAFEREEEHLYTFYIAPPGVKLTPRKRLEQATEYCHPESFSDGPFAFDDEDKIDASKTRIGSLNLQKGQLIDYLFDYGDEWWHEMKLERIEPPDPNLRYPAIVEIHGEAPPQYEDPEEEYDDDEYDEDEAEEGDDIVVEFSDEAPPGTTVVTPKEEEPQTPPEPYAKREGELDLGWADKENKPENSSESGDKPEDQK